MLFTFQLIAPLHQMKCLLALSKKIALSLVNDLLQLPTRQAIYFQRETIFGRPGFLASDTQGR